MIRSFSAAGEIVDDNGIPEISSSTDESKQRTQSVKKRVFAAVLSALLPGSGQSLLRLRKRAAVFFALLILYALVFVLARAPSYYASFVISIWILLALLFASALDALFAQHSIEPKASAWWVAAIIPALLIGISLHANLLLRAAGFRNFVIPSSSMEPSIMLGDYLNADLRAYDSNAPRVGEIVMFHRNNAMFIKRVVAVGPCTVEGRDGEIFVDGKHLEDNYAVHSDPRGEPAQQMQNFGPVPVDSGSLFVVGDNIDVSLDSRIFGPIGRASVFAKPLYIYRPLARAGIRIR